MYIILSLVAVILYVVKRVVSHIIKNLHFDSENLFSQFAKDDEK